MSLHQMNKQEFLSKYWQKRPLVIRGGLKGISAILEADDLAGLACEEGVESRIVQEKGPEEDWQVSHGPFDEGIFQTLPASHWTLLVQGVEQWVPEVSQLMTHFQFIPNWRVDDIMISYAPEAGTVGPHTDNYDVFLLQAQGRREWRVGRKPLVKEDLIPGLSLKILKSFDDYDTYVVEEGDILYLPPMYAHHGISLDESICYSVGFRAPHDKELLGHYCDYLLLQDKHSEHYSDPDLALQDNPGEMSGSAINALHKRIGAAVLDEKSFAKFLGSYMSLPKHDLQPQAQLDFRIESLEDEQEVEIFLGARTCYQINDDRVDFFINGQSYSAYENSLSFIKSLCGMRGPIQWKNLKGQMESEEVWALAESLFKDGWLFVGEE